MTYQDTSLWKRTLGVDDKNVEPLRESFLEARKNAEFLLDKIRGDFPNLTMHDITHVDSLWNVADVIIGKKYPVNPLEGYVLGIAFLIHDAALSYDAVGGKDKLRDTMEWKDVYADGTRGRDEEGFKKECDFTAIRALHAKYAENLLFQTFIKNNGSSFYIIDNDTFRAHFGGLIGKIAASHHWSIDEVESELKKPTNPLSGMPGNWRVNARKLACILRCADAGHIDNGRAPDLIYRSLDVNGVSKQHWESQNHLCQVCEDEFNSTKVCITSSNPFKKEDFSAWNVAYDAVRLFDEELKKSNDLLKRITPQNSMELAFLHKGVSGTESKEALAKYIETEGWQPCSFGVHTSNVKALIENLGGSKLYGDDNLLLVALRELIQNARDAIHARKILDGGFDEGRITIRLDYEAGGWWVEVEDDGIGMSMDCIKHHLLDFGSSYWKSPLAKHEAPGLRSNGFKSIGKYGIGFYSVFMVAKSVEVVTRRYDKGKDDAKRIEFPDGLTLSPVLSEAKLSTSISTMVKFELKDYESTRFFVGYKSIEFKKAIQILVAGLDADVYYNGTDEKNCIHISIISPKFDKKKWLEGLCYSCPKNIEYLASNLEVLKDDNGDVRGMIIAPEYYIWKSNAYFDSFYYDRNQERPCIKTIGGLLSSLELKKSFVNNGYFGYLDGVEDSLDRNKMVFDELLKKCLRNWAKEKYLINYDSLFDNDMLAYEYSKLINFCGIEDEIVKDNILRLYSSKDSWIRKETTRGFGWVLMDIHFLLFVGTQIDAGWFCTSKRSGNITRIGNEVLYLCSLSLKDLRKELETIDFFKDEQSIKIARLVIIGHFPTLSYKDIVDKYCFLMLSRPFADGNKRVLRVWMNLMLDLRVHKMVNWENVDEKRLMEMIIMTYGRASSKLIVRNEDGSCIVNAITNDFSDNVSNYLMQFLS